MRNTPKHGEIGIQIAAVVAGVDVKRRGRTIDVGLSGYAGRQGHGDVAVGIAEPIATFSRNGRFGADRGTGALQAATLYDEIFDDTLDNHVVETAIVDIGQKVGCRAWCASAVEFQNDRTLRGIQQNPWV